MGFKKDPSDCFRALDSSRPLSGPNLADRVIVHGTRYNHPSNSAEHGLHRFDSLIMCRVLKQFFFTTNQSESREQNDDGHIRPTRIPVEPQNHR
jgi:hypothetical protein